MWLSLIMQHGGRSVRSTARQAFSRQAASAESRALSWHRVTAAAGHGAQSGGAAAAADWHRQRAPPPPAASAAAAACGPPQERAASSVAQPLPHLQQLSEEQLAAVTAPLGTVRVVAGPGSGKTRVLTARIAQLIHAHSARPWQVLAITFTNKAANEMRERLAGMLGQDAGEQLFAGTFHSLCYRILKRHIGHLPGAGRTSAFTVYDQDMSARLLARAVRGQQPEWKARDVSAKAAALQDAISRVKSGMLMWHAATPQAVEQAVREHLAAAEGAAAVQPAAADDIAAWFGQYEQALRANNALDFDDLLGLAVALLRRSDDVRQRYQRRFRHVLVDEFQDTNSSQYELVKLLSQPRCDLFVVGDPDQSIYGWRGADMGNMTRAFARDFPRAQVCDLRDNYRSCARIVATAQHVIAANEDWQRAGLRARRPAGDQIEVHVLEDSQQEARFLAAQIQRTLASGEHPAEQVAVLFRTHIQARLVEQELVKRNIAHVLIGGVPFWRRLEVQDVMAYLRLAVSLRDDVAMARIINTPRRGIGDSSLEKLQAAAAAQGHTLCALLFGSGGAGQAAAADGVAAPVLPTLPDRKELGLTAKAAAAVEAFRELMAGLHAAVASQPLDRALEQILAKTGYERYVLEGGCSSGSSKEGEERERLQRIQQLVAAAAGYQPGELSGAAALDTDYDADGELPAGSSSSGSSSSGSGSGSLPPLQLAQNFLDEAALYSGAEEGGQAARGVRLMTMHAAKGLEFELVFIPGCNEGLVPLVRASGGGSPDSLPEERRLFYVSLTRAKHRLRLTHTLHTSHFGPQSRKESEPSRFLADVLSAGHAVLLESPEAADVAAPGRARHRRAGTWQRRPAGETRYGSQAASDRRWGGAGGEGVVSSSSSSSSSGRPTSHPPASHTSQPPPPPPPPLSSAQEKARQRGGRR